MSDSIGSSLTIGDNQTACAEIDATIIADNYNQYIRELCGIDLSKNRLSGCRRWFAIVVGTELCSLGTQHIGIADVAGIVVLLTIVSQQFLDLINGGYMMSEGEELTSLFSIIALASALYGFVFVEH
jgi:hypothetical protein